MIKNQQLTRYEFKYFLRNDTAESIFKIALNLESLIEALHNVDYEARIENLVQSQKG